MKSGKNINPLANFGRPVLRVEKKIQMVSIAFLLGTLLLASAAVAGEPDFDSLAGIGFLKTEYEVLGRSTSTLWQETGHSSLQFFAQIGGQSSGGEFGSATPEDEVDSGPSNTGNKVKAGLLSAVLPGAGQYYNGDKGKAYVMFGVEVAIWTAYFVFDAQGDSKREDAEEWAAIYAGTSGEHSERYWQDVGHFANSDDFNESVLREARATGDSPSGLIGSTDQWEWVNVDRRIGYSSLRSDGNSAYDRRDFMILFAVVNRVVSVVDAVIGAGQDDGLLETEVLGMNIELQMMPSFSNPGALCVVSRSF